MNSVQVHAKPSRGAEKRKVTFFCPKFEQQSAIISSKRYEIECHLVLITNRMSPYVLLIGADIDGLE